MAGKTRTELKRYFVKNAIPTEGNFADLINAPLNQADDGVFRLPNEPLAVVAAGGEQRRVLQLYANYPATNPDWQFSLNPKHPIMPDTTVAGLGIVDGAGKTRLLLDAADGSLTVAANVAYGGQLSKLDVVESYAATVRAADFWLGHSSRRGSPGRAMVDAKTELKINYAKDWPRVTIDSPAHIYGSLSVIANGPVVDLIGVDHAYVQFFPLGVGSQRQGYIGYGNAGTKHLTVRSELGNLELAGTNVIAYAPLSVTGALTVTGGAIVPAAGNSATAGIRFPADPGGGGGDAAWIHYYPRTGEQCTLEIGISNDGDDHIALMPTGGVGIGTVTPAAKLDVLGNVIVRSPGAAFAGLSFTRTDEGNRQHQWAFWHMNTQYRKNALELWEYKTDSTGTACGGNAADGAMCNVRLMVTEGGNVGIGREPERMLDIDGTLRSGGEIQTTSANAIRMVRGGYGAFWRNDGTNTYLLLTNSGDQYGLWNELRPFTVNNASGALNVGGTLNTGGEIQTTSANAIRMVQGNYGVFWRNDGEKTQLLLTNSGDQYGQWNGLRPFTVNNASGALNVGGTLDVKGSLSAWANGPVIDVVGGDHAYIAFRPQGVGTRKGWIGYGSAGTEQLTVHSEGGPLRLAVGVGANAFVTIDSEGRIGTSGRSPTDVPAGWAGGLATWDIVARGQITCDNDIFGKAYKTPGQDVAEAFMSKVELAAGDVVSLADQQGYVEPAGTPFDSRVAGIVSSEPGIALNSPLERDAKAFPIALSGRVPCKVVDEGGPISVGDLLTTSSTSGHAMKASRAGENVPAGTVIGKAMERFDGHRGVITVFVFVR